MHKYWIFLYALVLLVRVWHHQILLLLQVVNSQPFFLENIHSWHVDSIFHWNEQMKQISIPIPFHVYLFVTFFHFEASIAKKKKRILLLVENKLLIRIGYGRKRHFHGPERLVIALWFSIDNFFIEKHWNTGAEVNVNKDDHVQKCEDVT